ncbi:MAG: cytochrome P450 [Caulobacterales bacterium]
MNQNPPAHVPASLVVDFDVYSPPGSQTDFYSSWLPLLRDEVPPMVWTTANGGHWMPTKGEVVKQMWGDNERFSNRISIVPKEVGEQFFGIPQSLDPPKHQDFRMLLTGVLGPKVINKMEADVRALAVSLIEAVLPRGECEFTRDYAGVLPVRIFMRMVDLPIEDAAYLVEINEHIIRPTGEMSVMEANEKLHDYLRKPVMERLGKDGDDMLSRMINGKVEGGRSLTPDEALNMAKLVLQGGIDTVSNLLSFAMHFLATNPDHRRRLLTEPDIIPAAIEELLRRFPVICTARMVKEDMRYFGADMRKGDAVVMPNPLHGLDERENADAFRPDFDRKERSHSAFGQGIHRCPGAYLARLEARVTIEEWLKRIPEFRLATDDIRFRGGVIATVELLPLVWS